MKPLFIKAYPVDPAKASLGDNEPTVSQARGRGIGMTGTLHNNGGLGKALPLHELGFGLWRRIPSDGDAET